MKVLHCREVGFDCPGVIKAENESDVLQLAAQHASGEHQGQVTPGMAEQIKTLIREE